MEFTELGPPSLSSTTRYMRLQSSLSRYLQFTVPSTLAQTVGREGLIVTFWLKIKSKSLGPIFEFGNVGAHVWLYNEWNDFYFNLFWQSGSLKLSGVFTLNKWYHLGIVFKQSIDETEIWIDGIKVSTEV